MRGIGSGCEIHSAREEDATQNVLNTKRAQGFCPCLGGRRPQGVCPELPRPRSPPLPRMRARWHRFQGACQGCSITPPGAGRGQKGEGVAGSGAARGAGGRRGSAPSPRANAPRRSLACARAGTVFRARARGAVSRGGRRGEMHVWGKNDSGASMVRWARRRQVWRGGGVLHTGYQATPQRPT